MPDRTPFTRHRRTRQLDAYWDTVIEGDPSMPIVPVDVDRADALLVRRMQSLASSPTPDPEFAARLEQNLMNAYVAPAPSPIAEALPTIPQHHPSLNPSRGKAPVSHRRLTTPRPRTSWTLRPAIAIALAILLVLASIGGIWLTNMNTAQDEPNRLMAPVVATPSPDASPAWSHFKGDAARRGETDAGPVTQPVELWRYQAGDACNPSPAAIGDTIYVACNDRMLTALDALTGSVRWQFSAEPFVNGPSVDGGVAYVVGASGALYAVDIATGIELWRVEGNALVTSPAVDGETLVAGSSDGVLIGIDTATGTERWRAQVIETGLVRNPALADGIAYAGSESGGLVAVDVASGEILWRGDTGTDSTGTTTVHNGIVYISHSPGNDPAALFAFDAETGDLLWQRDEWMGSPSISGTIGISANQQGDVVAFDLTTGDELWRTEVGGEVRPIPVSSEIVYVPSDGDRAIYAYDLHSGDVLWSIAVDGGMYDGPAVTGGRIYVTTTFGVVQAFGEGDANAIAASPIASPDASAVANPGATPDDSAVASPRATTNVAFALAWQSTAGPDPLLFPTGLDVAPDGTLWVVDSANNRFQLFSPDGEYLETWGEAGDGDGQFNFVRSPGDPGNSTGNIAFAPDGSFYVADTANRRVQHFGADRAFLGAWGSLGPGDGQFVDPLSVAVAPDGNVYVIDDQRDDIQVFDPEGTYLFTFGGHGTGPGQLNATGWLTIDTDGNVWVADFLNHRVQQFAADGTFVMAFGEFGSGEGQLNRPAGIAIDQAGTIYVTEPEMIRVQAFSPEGEFLGMWAPPGDTGGEPFVPIGITVDAEGYVYVADVVGGSVQKLNVTLPEAAATPVATP